MQLQPGVMRLLLIRDDGTLNLTKDLIEDIPAYGILSHKWGIDEEEISFQDLQAKDDSWRKKAAFSKVQLSAHL